MDKLVIKSGYTEYNLRTVRHFPEIAVKNEPMLFNCNLEGAEKLGGPITKAFLEVLPSDWLNVPLVIDSRVHMLMPGWYPCIPGWHHDDVPRTRSDGQPNYEFGQNRSAHMMMLVNGDICPTEFAVGQAEFDIPPLGRVIYEDWHRAVEEKIDAGILLRKRIPTNTLITFNDRTWHQGTTALQNGWRFFIRASRYYDCDFRPIDRGNLRTNELRRQVQVYMPSINAGW